MRAICIFKQGYSQIVSNLLCYLAGKLQMSSMILARLQSYLDFLGITWQQQCVTISDILAGYPAVGLFMTLLPHQVL